MRVVTLLPAATEIVAALGAADRLVGISHECDYPAELSHLPRITTTPVDAAATGAVIDAAVRRLRNGGKSVIVLDSAQLARLAPDLVITQELCDVCAVADGEVHRRISTLGSALGHPPRVVSLGGHDVRGIADDIRTVGAALQLEARADSLATDLTETIERMRQGRRKVRPRVVCIEWLDPVYLAGHWVPELVRAAGGEDVGAPPGARSQRLSWKDVALLRPDVIVVMLCGFGVRRALAELNALADAEGLALMERVPVRVIDGNAFTSRPGPRVIEGARQIRLALDGASDGPLRWTPEHARAG